MSTSMHMFILWPDADGSQTHRQHTEAEHVIFFAACADVQNTAQRERHKKTGLVSMQMAGVWHHVTVRLPASQRVNGRNGK
jgi:hypothetical protein